MKPFSKLCFLSSLLALASSVSPVLAEDIDLFIGAQATSNAQPNVLFIIDNTANWEQAFENEMEALQTVFDDLPIGKVKVGVMFSSETGGQNNNVSGGYVRAAIRAMDDEDIKDAYGDMFAAMDKQKDAGNGGKSSLVMAEAYRYFTGGTPIAGNNKQKADYDGNTTSSWSGSVSTAATRAAMQAIYDMDDNALNTKNATSYNQPETGSGCAKQFIIYISNGPSQDNTSVISDATTYLSAAGGDTTPIQLSIAGSQDNVSDEWAQFLYNSLGIVTYTIEVNKKLTGAGPGWSALLSSMASVSKGKYQDVSTAAEDIEAAIKETLTEIQATNSVFASVSLPLSANTQGTYLNQVYVGLFRPDGTALPRWDGNLKQYKLGYDDSGDLRLLDSTSQSAIDPSSGFVRVCSKSFWSTQSTYWNFRSEQFEDQAGCSVAEGAPDPEGSDYPDGKFVEKGGQAQQLRNTSNADRDLMTCSAFSCNSVQEFSTSSVSAAALGVDSSEHQELVNWARGQDVDDEHTDDGIDPSSGTSTAMRPSVHGDVVHSRPVAINFGSDSDPQVVVFYGGNDGVFRAVNGNRPDEDSTSDNIAGIAPGGELWGFVPPEFHGEFDRLRDNEVQISFSNVEADDALPKPYAMDGAITAYRAGNDAWVFSTMRRGGRAVYAFHVDADQPSIQLEWKVGCDPTGATCTDGDFTDIGQTWSPARPFKAAGFASGTEPLLIMGGGYDTCEDSKPHTCTSTSKGRKVYVLDAQDGDVERVFTTDRSVVAEIAVVPDLTTGLALYAYVVDLGGNVYRIDMGNDSPSNWTMTQIASLGCATADSTCTYNRKFMFAPDVLLDNGSYVLLLGSGDREKPREYSHTVDNYFFMLKDRPTDADWLSSESGNCTQSLMCLDSLLAIGDDDPTTEELSAKKGWYLELNPTEQVVTSAITIFGTVTFSTHEPDTAAPGECSSNLGLARVYNISYLNAAAADGTERSQELPPDIGLPPSPVAGLVTLDNGQTVPFCIGCSADSPLEAEEPEPPATSLPVQPKSRVYWYIRR